LGRPTHGLETAAWKAVGSDRPVSARRSPGLSSWPGGDDAGQLRFDANVSILFDDRPMLERPALAAAAGFDAIEMWWPFARGVPGTVEVDRLVASVADEGLALVMLNLYAGSSSTEEHGLLTLPGRQAEFRDNVDVAIEISSRLGGRVLNALYGNLVEDEPEAERMATAIENLAYVADRAAREGIGVVIEPLNALDFPRYGLRTIEEAAAVADRARTEAGAEIGILFDVYHTQRTEGDLARRIQGYADRFGHVQIADAPGRSRPGTGEIAFGFIFASLVSAGYRGFVGLEYRPSPDPEDTFAWLPPQRRRSGAAPNSGRRTRG
jgi:hydroxypyruvate isomerase